MNGAAEEAFAPATPSGAPFGNRVEVASSCRPHARARWLWPARALALLALLNGGYLLWVSRVAGAQVAGCGNAGDFGCGHVLHSRWSRSFGTPVPVPGTIAYALTLLALFWIRPRESSPGQRLVWRLLLALASTFVGTAIWFLALQALVLGSFCAYCVTAHACGLLLAGLVFWACPVRWRPAGTGGPGPVIKPAAGAGSILLGLMGTAGLVAGQVLDNDRPPGLLLETVIGPNGQTITLEGMDYPRLGTNQARFVVVELFDYTCGHCRATAAYLEKARRRYADQLAILLVVAPLHPGCNRQVPALNPLHDHACEFARLALAVWRARPSAFETFHLWLIGAERDPETARQYAVELVGAQALEAALADDASNRDLERHVQVYARFGGGPLPKLIYGSDAALGQPGSARELFDFLEVDVGVQPAAVETRNDMPSAFGLLP